MSEIAKIHVNSCLSQGFLPIVPQKSFGTKSAAIHNQQVFAAALDENNRLWMAMPLNGCNTGSVLQKTSYAATSTVYFSASDGELLHFTSVQNEVLVQRHAECTHTDQPPVFQRLMIPPPSPHAVVNHIVVSEYHADGVSQILLAVYFLAQDGYELTLSYWDRIGNPSSFGLSQTVGSTNGHWHITETAISFCALDAAKEKVWLFDLDCQNTRSLLLPSSVKDVAWYSKGNRILGVLLGEDGQLSHMEVGETALSIHSLFDYQDNEAQICPFDEIMLESKGQGNRVHLWGRSGNHLHHYSDLAEFGNLPSELITVEDCVESFHVCSSSGGDSCVMAARTISSNDGSNQMLLYRIPGQGALTTHQISADTEITCQTIQCYLTEITLQDQAGNPVPQCQVYLKSESACTLYVGDRQYTLAPGQVCTQAVTTDQQGKLTIRQPQESLDAVDFSFQISGESDWYTVTPDSQVIATLKGLTADSLLQQDMDDGSKLIDGSLDQETRKSTAKHLADTMNSMFQVVSTQNAAPHAGRPDRLDPSSRRFAHLHTDEVHSAPVPINMGRFHVIFSPQGTLSVEHITSEEHLEHLYQRIYDGVGTYVPGRSSSNGLFSKLGEFLHSVARGFAKLTEMIVHTAEVCFRYVVDGVARVAHFVVKTIKDVAHCACELFHSVSIGFEKLIRWLGILFDWDDIKRTKQLLESWLDDGFSRARTWMADPARMQDIDRITKYIEEKLDELLKKLKRPLDIDSLQTTAQQNPQLTAVSDTFSAGNLMVQKLQEPGALCCTSPLLSAPSPDFWADLLEDLKQIPLPEEAWQDFQRDISALVSGGSSLNAILDAVIDLLRMILHLVVEFFSAVAKTIWKAISQLLEALLDLIEQPIYIPVLSPILRLCGVTLPSLKDVILYMAAIPATTLYKMIYHAPPVPDMNQCPSAQVSSKLLDIFQFIFCTLFYITNEICCAEEIGEEGEPNKFICGCSSCLGLTWIGISYGREIAEGASDVTLCTWLCFSCDVIGFSIDIISLFVNRFPTKLQMGCELTLGAIYTVCSAVDCWDDDDSSDAEMAGYILPGVHDIIMSGRFIDGYTGPICFGVAAAAAVGVVICEGICDFSAS